MNDKPKTRTEKIIDRMKDHPILATPIVVGACVIALASFADAPSRLWAIAPGVSPEPGFTVSGDLIPESGVTVSGKLAVSIIWGLDDRISEQGGDTSFQSSRIASADPSSGRIAYSISLTDAPPGEVLMDLKGVKLGVGVIIAFSDTNENGILDDGEKTLGASAKNAITYLRGDLKAFAADMGKKKLYTLLSIPQGYSLTEAIPPEKHGFPVRFDDLVPIDKKPINIILPRDKKQIRVPNWT